MCPEHNMTARSNSLWLSQLFTRPHLGMHLGIHTVGSAPDTEHREVVAHLGLEPYTHKAFQALTGSTLCPYHLLC